SRISANSPHRAGDPAPRSTPAGRAVGVRVGVGVGGIGTSHEGGGSRRGTHSVLAGPHTLARLRTYASVMERHHNTGPPAGRITALADDRYCRWSAASTAAVADTQTCSLRAVATRGWLHDFADSAGFWDGLLHPACGTAVPITEQAGRPGAASWQSPRRVQAVPASARLRASRNDLHAHPTCHCSTRRVI